jgi:hypothetical protein
LIGSIDSGSTGYRTGGYADGDGGAVLRRCARCDERINGRLLGANVADDCAPTGRLGLAEGAREFPRRLRNDANVAVATGHLFWVLDADLWKGGCDSLAELEHVHGALPDTVTAQTGGGGMHLFFSYDADRPVPCSTGVLPGIDVRGTGGYVVMPPALHISGRRYTFLIGYGPHEIGLAAAHDWLLNVVQRRRVRGRGPQLS